ncbi:MAG: hypothetical protein ABIV63_08460, partial [Caldimonas sp.]
ARPLRSISSAAVPHDLESAYRLQRAIGAAFGEARGWKISGLTPAQQHDMGVECPLAAPLLADWTHDSGAAFVLQGFIKPRLECEFAFELGADVPPRDAPYVRAEVEAAILALRIGVEVVDSRLPTGSPVLLELADDLNNGAYVIGPATMQWQAVRPATQSIALHRRHAGNDEIIAAGDGRAILEGDLVGALLLLANLPALKPRGLRSGDVVTTGSCTGAVPVPGPGDYQADFGSLGSVHLRFS